MLRPMLRPYRGRASTVIYAAFISRWGELPLGLIVRVSGLRPGRGDSRSVRPEKETSKMVNRSYLPGISAELHALAGRPYGQGWWLIEVSSWKEAR